MRAIQEIVDKLKDVQGVEIVEWKPYKHDEAWSIISNLYFCDGGQEEFAALEASGEPLRPLTNFILKENPSVKKLTVEEIWRGTTKREAYRTQYAKIWNETATRTSVTGELEGMVDVILCPVGPGAAPPLDCARYWGYTTQWNLLDYPALIFPVTRVDPKIDVIDEDYVPMNEKDKYNHELWKSGPERYKGAPISLQLVGRRYEDEKVRLSAPSGRRWHVANGVRWLRLWNLSKKTLAFHLRTLCDRRVLCPTERHVLEAP